MTKKEKFNAVVEAVKEAHAKHQPVLVGTITIETSELLSRLLTVSYTHLYSGNDDQVLPILSLGGLGVISVLSNVAPKFTHDMVMKYFDGDTKGATEDQLKALPLINALFSEVNPIPVKTAMNLMGMNVGPLRMPLCEMEEDTKAALAKEIEKFGLKLAK